MIPQNDYDYLDQMDSGPFKDMLKEIEERTKDLSEDDKIKLQEIVEELTEQNLPTQPTNLTDQEIIEKVRDIILEALDQVGAPAKKLEGLDLLKKLW